MKFISKVNKFTYFVKEQVLFTSFDGSQRTKLSGEDAVNKKEMFELVNSHYRDGLHNVLLSFTDIKSSSEAYPIVEELYEEGVVIRYIPEVLASERVLKNSDTGTPSFMQQHKDSQTVFISFRIKNVPFKERFYYLIREARIRQGLLPYIDDLYYFTVIETKKISKKMLRIFIRSDIELPTDSPGFAYRFILNTLDIKTKVLNSLSFKNIEKMHSKIEKIPFLENKIGKIKTHSFILVFEFLKRLPKKQEGTEEDGNKNKKKVDKKAGRYYTLRQLKNCPYTKESNKNYCYGEVDIHLHGETAGGIWATSLKKGDVIYANYDYEETIQNMTVGQALLICDETSMPSVAAVLEQWQSPITPIVISIANEQDDFKYFDECEIADCIKDELEIIHIIPESQKDIAPMVIEHIQKIDKQIDCAWGAIGATQVKPIKKYLSEKYNLKGKLNRIRAYWN